MTKPKTIAAAMTANFMGRNTASWYKNIIIFFLIINPMVMLTMGKFVAGWLLIPEFILTLAMALKGYPLGPAGILAIEAVIIGMASPASVYKEVEHNFPVLLLLMFMVAAIHFMKDMLLFVFRDLLVRVRSKIMISLIFCFLGAFLSAFLDALTVTAVIMAVATGFFMVYHRHASGKKHEDNHDHTQDHEVEGIHRQDLQDFRGFLRNLMMHGAVGTALGGVCTLVGEPQNIIVGHQMEWHFGHFFLRMAPVTMPVLAVGFLTCILVEATKSFGYGYKLPRSVWDVLHKSDQEAKSTMTKDDVAKLFIQACGAILLVAALAFHVAEVGLIGLMIIVLLTTFNGVTEEHQIGHSFQESMPFCALLVVFFTIIAVIHDQHLFTPIINWVLSMSGKKQLVAFYVANGLLSAISDNVFVATVYITEAKTALAAGLLSQEQMELVAVAINTGTNIPSVATPNGQAAFLFLLTSGLAPLIRLGYMEMVKLALPYTITMSITGLLAVIYLL